MKKLLLLILPIVMLSSCNSTSYSSKRDAEDKLIADFIKRQGINVLYEIPADSAWGEKDYYLIEKTGLYFHLSEVGDTSTMISAGDKVLVRYIAYTLNANADTARYMTTAEQAYPTEFLYLYDYTTAPVGWHTAIGLMKHSGASCKIICPSKQGFDADQSTVTPRGYDLTIKFNRY